ncbi:peptide MFS transporter [Sediminitomix flava]|uniref:POT family proton-dependent oligopeptide transporter n=1 Tax=Sediminitomix flava TaxID=379075 RepID=A0A315ZAG2_SEDFL|nr:peptide MFS transporter [Sediminitomix flava]PWJ41828.1 POT family proton-dependent oligopeptide transporter [Sediminitomix flava]
MAKTFFGHPIGLSTLFATEFWERFSYYGMRSFLTLFLTATYINGGFGMSQEESLAIYGIFTSLVYVTPIIGGILADKVLGQRVTVYIGALVMAAGQFTMAYSAMMDPEAASATREFLLHAGLGLLIVGNGFFKPNISTMVGGLYEANDPNRDGGFTLFYMGINAGAFFAPVIAGSLAEKVAWQYGFMSAGIGMLLGTAWFFFRETTMNNVGLAPKASESANKIERSDWMNVVAYAIGSIVLVLGFLKIWGLIPSDVQSYIVYAVAIGGVGYLLWTIVVNTKGSTEWSRVGVILLLAVFNVIFWSGFEQAGGTFNFFAKENTDRMLFGSEIPASIFQSVNAIAIFIFAPLFTVIWGKLDKAGKNPRTPVKFAIGLLMLAVGFFVMQIGANATKGGTVLVSPLWLVMVYLLHTWGELCLSPIGLSMITKLSPQKIVSVMMGLWMGSIAIGNYMAASMMGIFNSDVVKPLRDEYGLELFSFIGVEALVAGLLLLALSPKINKMMKGIH